MKLTNHYTAENEFERLQRQVAIHRKCLLILQTLSKQSPAAQKAG